MTVGRLLAEAWDLLLPAGCLACGDWMGEGTGDSLLCVGCRTRLPRAPWPRCGRCHMPLGTGRRSESVCPACRDWPEGLDQARFAFVLAPPADELVHALKYEGWRELAGEMGRAMAVAAREVAARAGSVVVPVPTTSARARTRGYNQAELLARSVAEELGCDLVDALRRRAGGRTQVALHPSQRRANVQGAFALRDKGIRAVEGRGVLLVDDVLTTGATACEAASALKAAGAADVVLVTYARAFPRR